MFAVGFDFDHTLGLDNKLEKVALLRVLSSYSNADTEARIDRALHTYRSGAMLLPPALYALFGEICGKDCNPQALFENFVQLVIELAPTHVKPLPGALELIARLDARGVSHAILTNGWNPLQQCKADLIGYTGPVIVSDDIEIRKPDPRAFAILARALETEPERILYIGDSPVADMSGALGAGMQGVWFNWEDQQYATSLPKPSAVISSLDEVDELIFSVRR